MISHVIALLILIALATQSSMIENTLRFVAVFSTFERRIDMLRHFTHKYTERLCAMPPIFCSQVFYGINADFVSEYRKISSYSETCLKQRPPMGQLRLAALDRWTL